MTISDDILKQQKADDEQHTPPSLVDQFRAALISAGFTPTVVVDDNLTTISAHSKSYAFTAGILRLDDDEQIADAMIDQAQGSEALRDREVEPEGEVG